ncbi:MAG: pseudouridine synthase [Paludibacteraceae bacterium]
MFREQTNRKNLLGNCATTARKITKQDYKHYLIRNEKQNKSYLYSSEKPNSKKAILSYKLIASSERYHLLEVKLEPGRHHQIRCQLAAIGCPIKGDLKYGAPRSNPNGGISLHARQIKFIHPVSKEPIEITAPIPEDEKLWSVFNVTQ